MPELMDHVVDNMENANLYLGQQVLSFNKRWLREHPATRDNFEYMARDQKANPLKYFMPNCASRDSFEDSPDHQFINMLSRFKALVCHNRHGKALANEELIQTLGGAVAIGNALVGMKCLDRSGAQCTVTGVFPQGKRQTYRLWFGQDPIVADADHLWKCKLITAPYRGIWKVDKWEVHTTEHIIKNWDKGYWIIPRAKSAQWTKTIKYPYRTGQHCGEYEELLTDDMIMVEHENRVALLRGLMDAKATIHRKRCRIVSTNKPFLDSCIRLVTSFGVPAYYTNTTANGWRIETGRFPFSPLGAGNKKVIITARVTPNVRAITRYEDSGIRECTCISVDSPDSTFLAGPFLVTHNTTIAYIALLTTGGLIDCDPNWPIFKNHGVRYVEYQGPKRVGISSYSWSHFKDTIIPLIIQKWTPLIELGKWEKAVPNVDSGKAIMDFTGGSKLFFKAESQKLVAFESTELDMFLHDEQLSRPKMQGAVQRLLTRIRRRGEGEDEEIYNGSHICGLTPHIVDGRADTGAGGWMYHLMTGRDRSMFKNPKFYAGDLKDVPHWIYDERTKAEEYEKLARAEEDYQKGIGLLTEVNNLKSRLLGVWETTGGSVLPEFDDAVHLVDDFPIPPEWTVYRTFDHGRTNASAMVCFAIDPQGNHFVFLGAQRKGMVIHNTVKEFMGVCGNKWKKRERYDAGYMAFERLEEVFTGFTPAMDLLDSRSYVKLTDVNEFTIGEMWQAAGFTKVQPASNADPKIRIQAISEMLAIDHERIHPITGKIGSPRLFFFKVGAKSIWQDVKDWKMKKPSREGIPSLDASRINDHAPTALGYGILAKLRFIPSRPCRPQDIKMVDCMIGKTNQVKKQPRRDKWTGV